MSYLQYTTPACKEYKHFLKEYYLNLKAVEDTWLKKNELTYIRLRLLEAADESRIRGDDPLALELSGSVTEENDFIQYSPIDVGDILHFHCDVTCVQRKRVLIEGAPGSGKTTIAKHICNEYAAGRLGQEFEMLIFVSLRLLQHYASGCNSLKDMMVLCSRELKSHLHEIITQIMKSQGKGVLFLLDGWDERPLNSTFLAQIMNGNELPASSVIVTSRHNAAESLYGLVNRRIEISPFSARQKEEFASAYFSNEAHKARLLDCLSTRPNLSDLCSYPMVMSMACFVCKVDGTLPSTMTEVYERFVILAINRHLKEKSQIKPSIRSLADILNSHVFHELRALTKLALEGVKSNCLIFSGQDYPEVNAIASHSYGLLITFNQIDSMGCDSTSHHFIHSSMQSYLAALELRFCDEKEQAVILKSVLPDMSPQSYPKEWVKYLGQLPEGIYKQQQIDSIECQLNERDEKCSKDHRLLFAQFFSGITGLKGDSSHDLLKMILEQSSAWYKSELPIILYESKNSEVARTALAGTTLDQLMFARVDNYLLFCAGWCIEQCGAEIRELTVNLSPDTQLHHFMSEHVHHSLRKLIIKGSVSVSGKSKCIPVT